LNAIVGQKLRPSLVLLSTFVRVVLAPIEFDGKLGFMAIKVEHIRCYRMLTAKFGTQTLVANQRPKQLLRLGLFLSQFPGERQEFGIERHFGFTTTG